MLILLPPSETKTERAGPRRGRPMDLDRLSFPELTATRRRVADALAEVSAGPDAPVLLGVGPGLRPDIGRNLRLATAPATRVADLYTGVLYDALDLASLDPAARRRADRWLVVVSALYGALRPRDRVAAYRLSMGRALPGVGPLAAAWREPLTGVLTEAAGRGVLVDCRSASYVAAWSPRGPLATHWVQVRVPGATHLAKRTRGLVARHLLQAGRDARTAPALAEVVGTAFDIALARPKGRTRPWTLDVRERPAVDDVSASAEDG